MSATITDMAGRQLIYQASFEHSIDISQLSGGIYLLELKANGFWAKQKFMK
ncbi:T9SS type A sorting domain-containing protein [Marinoscillum luteum]|uniref:T9SS type A sorting domain-containing protein n=1 Tax=Marinoscillum luteum TaxID=861051 RepID=A0ABW7N540_9BACT